MRGIARRLLPALALGGLLGAASAAAPRVHEVVIEGMEFHPPALRVSPGDVVVWTNRDFFPHDVTAENGAFRSGEIAPGASWQLSVGGPGEFDYYCSLHPPMTASLSVTEAR